MTSKIFQEDIAEVAASPEIRWENMKGAYVLITGATGLIGTSLVHTLSAANKAHALEMLTIAHGRDTTKGERLSQDCGSEFISGDIRKPIPKEILPSTIDYIFHCAAITKSAHMVAKPVDVITTAVDGTGNILELANPAASMTIREMAELVAHDVCCGKIDVVVNVPEDILKYGYSPDAGYTLNIDKLRALNWEPKYSLADMFKRVISDWQDSK